MLHLGGEVQRWCRYFGNHKLWWSGGEESLNGVGVIFKENLIDKIIQVERCGDRIIKLKLVLEGIIYNFISHMPHKSEDLGKRKKGFGFT